MNKIRRFFEDGRMLAAGRFLPTALLKERRARVSTVRINWFLGSVAVLPVDGLQDVSVRVYGDAEMAELLRIEPRGPGLNIDGRLPFRSGARLGTEELSPVTTRSAVVGGDVRVAMDEERILVNDDALDLGRLLVVVVEVPPQTNVEVRALIGTLRIGGDLQGSLFVSQLGIPRVFTEEVGSFEGRIANYGEVRLAAVRGGVNVQTWDGGTVEAGGVGGDLNITAFDGGRVVIGGGTSKGMLRVEMGGGYVEHRGTVAGAGHFIYMRGPGHAVFPDVLGGVNVRYPYGVVDLNGQRFGKFRQTVSG